MRLLAPYRIQAWPLTHSLDNQFSFPKRTFQQLTALVFVALLALFPSWVCAEPAEKIIIKEILIEGNRKIEEATIRYKMKTKAGEEFSVETLREDVKTLYGMGYFDQVTVDAEGFEGGLNLTVRIKEKPYVKEIELRGNKELDTKKIMEKVDLPLGTIANPLVLSQNGEKIRLFYEQEGYYQAAVTPATEPISEQEAKVVFAIEEGEKFEVQEISFTGNLAFSSSKLRKQMKTKKLFFFFFYGTLKDSELRADVDRLKALYMNNGYLDVKIGEPKVTIDREKSAIRISIDIQEGSQFQVGKVSISGASVFEGADLLKDLRTKEGAVFSYETLQRDIFFITDRYGEEGYIYADVAPVIDLDREKLLVQVKLSVQEGRQMRVERIEITGNDRTRDNVIRREFTIAERDIFNSGAIRRAKESLGSLGFFEEVKVDTVPGGAEDRLVVKLNVKEKMTGTFSLGGGYSSIDGAMVMAQIAESNFLGKGLRLSLTGELAQKRIRGIVSLHDPRVFDTYNSVGMDIYNQDRDYDTWQEGRMGGVLTFGRPIRWNLDGFTAYRYEKIDIHGVRHDAPDNVKDEEGTSVTSSLTLGLTRDLRDSRMDPTRGTKTLATATYAGGILGGTNEFIKLGADASHYQPLFWKVVGVIHGNIGYGTGQNGEDLPIQERYFLGGPTTVRGFDFQDVGPLDENGEPYGGNKSLCFNVEVIFPLIETFKGVIFYDRGNAWEEGDSYSLSDMRHSAGVGLRFFSPMGPIRLEYGWKLDQREGESKGRFHFSVGAFF